MSFFTKKSIRVGMMRFTLSESGINASVGIKGFRFGTGPRGNYIYLGAGGISYRVSLPPKSPPSVRKKNPFISDSTSVGHDQTHAPLEEIESSHITELTDSSSRELLEELNSKKNKRHFWPVIAMILIGIIFCSYSPSWPEWCVPLAIISGIAITGLTYYYDKQRKIAVLFYDFDTSMKSYYQQLHDSLSKLAQCSLIWHVEASGAVYDPKYHAGANNLISRKVTIFDNRKPPDLKTNIDIFSVNVGRQMLYFFPERILIYDCDGIGAVGYDQLSVNVSNGRFVEDNIVPSDARIVDRTWKYVNKSGGPDRRFKDNVEIPVCEYQDISLTSHSGLNEQLQLSCTDYGREFKRAIAAISMNIQTP